MAQVDDDGSGDVDFREFAEWFLRMEEDELTVLEDALVQQEMLEEAVVRTVTHASPWPSRSQVQHLCCFLTV